MTVKRCIQCKRDLPEIAFLTMSRGYRVKKCNQCAHENMIKWEHGKKAMEPLKGYNPADHVVEAED